MKLSNTNICTFCQKENETLIHLFWECTVVQKLMSDLIDTAKTQDTSFEPDVQTFVLGSPGNNQYNLLCLEIKRYIYLCRRKNVLPTIHGLIGSLKLASAIISTSKTKMEDNKNNWILIQKIIF